MQRPPGQVPGLDQGHAAPLVDEVQITVISERGTRRRVALRSGVAAVLVAAVAATSIVLSSFGAPAGQHAPRSAGAVAPVVTLSLREARAEWIEAREGVSARDDSDHP